MIAAMPNYCTNVEFALSAVNLGSLRGFTHCKGLLVRKKTKRVRESIQYRYPLCRWLAL